MSIITARGALPYSRILLSWDRIRSHAVLIAITAFLLFLVLIPLVRLLLSSFQLGHPAIPAGWTLQNYIAAYTMPRFYEALGTTVLLSAVGTFINFGHRCPVRVADRAHRHAAQESRVDADFDPNGDTRGLVCSRLVAPPFAEDRRDQRRPAKLVGMDRHQHQRRPARTSTLWEGLSFWMGYAASQRFSSC